MQEWPTIDDGESGLFTRCWFKIAIPISFLCSKLPLIKRHPFAQLSRYSSLQKRPLFWGQSTAKPAGVALDPSEVAFVDVFCTEDFEELKSGLRAMRRTYEYQMYSLKDQLEEWFAQLSLDTDQWLLFGSWPELPRRKKFRYLDSITVELFGISSSFVAVALRVTPSQKFKDEFQELIAKNEQAKKTLQKSDIHRSHWYVSDIQPVQCRRIKIARLFLALNREATFFLRRYVNTGWCQHGPLPSIESYLVDGEIDPKEQRNFWESLGMDLSVDWEIYHSEGFRFFSVGQGLYPANTWKILVEKKKLQRSSTEAYASDELAIENVLQENFLHLPGLLGIRELHKRLENEVAILRRNISPQLVRLSFGIFKWLKAFRDYLRISELSFQKSRLFSQIDPKKATIFTNPEVRDLIRTDHKGKQYKFLDDLKFVISRMRKRIATELDLLNESYDKKFDFRLQQTNFYLAIVGTVLAFVGVLLAIPDNWRNGLWNQLVEFLK